MDEVFGLRFEDLFMASRTTHPGIDVGDALVFSESKQVGSDRDSVDKILQGAAGKEFGERFLATEDDL